MCIGDQGWGNQKGQVELKLCRGMPDSNSKEISEWNDEGAGWASHVI